MFNLDYMFGALFLIGVLTGLLLIGIPGYFIGMSRGIAIGKECVYREAIDHGVLKVEYNRESGMKEYIWLLKK